MARPSKSKPAAKRLSLSAEEEQYLAGEAIRGLGRHDLGDVEAEQQLAIAEAYLMICAESDTPLTSPWLHVIAEEYFRLCGKKLRSRARRSERDRITYNAVCAAIKRGYSSSVEKRDSVSCFEIACKMIEAAGLIDRAELNPHKVTNPVETIKARFYTIMRERRPGRLYHELFGKFLQTTIDD